MNAVELSEKLKLIEKIKPQYIDSRLLADGSVACIGDLIFTRNIFLGCDEFGYATTFFFEDKELAMKRFFELTSKDDVPEGAVARRG